MIKDNKLVIKLQKYYKNIIEINFDTLKIKYLQEFECCYTKLQQKERLTICIFIRKFRWMKARAELRVCSFV